MDSSAPTAADTTPSVGELTAEFAKQKRAKSPPLAFEPTPNDSLAPRISPTRSRSGHFDNLSVSSPTMGRLSPLHSAEVQALQEVVDYQADALQKAHEEFAVERHAWYKERAGFRRRIAKLEQLLKNADGDRYVAIGQVPSLFALTFAAVLPNRQSYLHSMVVASHHRTQSLWQMLVGCQVYRKMRTHLRCPGGGPELHNPSIFQASTTSWRQRKSTASAGHR